MPLVYLGNWAQEIRVAKGGWKTETEKEGKPIQESVIELVPAVVPWRPSPVLDSPCEKPSRIFFKSGSMEVFKFLAQLPSLKDCSEDVNCLQSQACICVRVAGCWASRVDSVGRQQQKGPAAEATRSGCTYRYLAAIETGKAFLPTNTIRALVLIKQSAGRGDKL